MVTLTRIKELVDALVIKRALVIAPLRVAESTWATEAAKWDHLKDLRISVALGHHHHRRAAFRKDADIYVINRENIPWLVQTLLDAKQKWPFDLVVIDELTSFKNPSSKRWRMLRRVIGASDYVIGLTGTPAPNGYEDLWAEMYLIDNGEALGKTLTEYRNTYFHPGRGNGHVIYEYLLNKGSKEKIDAKLKPLCLSMTKEDWLELPPITTNVVSVRMNQNERAVYDQMLKDSILPLLDEKVSSLDESESAVVGSTAAVLSNKLLQMANGAVYDDAGKVFVVHPRKMDALDEIYCSGGDNILVFYEYLHDLNRILSYYPDARVLGDAKDIEDWNAGEIKMLLCHPASAAYGINLQQGGHTIVWFGLPWSLELHQQANARLYRQGQEHPVVVHYIICEDTLDEKVYAVLQKKDAVQRGLLDALKEYVEKEK